MNSYMYLYELFVKLGFPLFLVLTYDIIHLTFPRIILPGKKPSGHSSRNTHTFPLV